MHPGYGYEEMEEMFRYVEERLAARDTLATKTSAFPFRRRSAHIRRVCMWAQRLMQQELPRPIDREALAIAAVFHDVGYALPPYDGTGHAQGSALIFEEYAAAHGFGPEQQKFISYLIANHSNKEMLKLSDTPLELVLLMEADLLDETGALSLVWDGLAIGLKEEPSYEKAYERMCITRQEHEDCPLVTGMGRKIWEEKRALVRGFVELLENDLRMMPEVPIL